MSADGPAARVQSEDFRNVYASGRATDAIAQMDEIRGDPFFAALKARSFELMRASPGGRVLDAGCGAGDDVIALARIVGPAGRAQGLDFSSAMVAEARRRASASGIEAEFTVASVAAMPFENNAFDGIRCERTLQHVEDIEASLREMVRILRPGGSIVVIDADRGVSASDFPGWDGDIEERLARWRAASGPVRNGLISRQARRHLIGLGLEDVVAEPWVNTSAAELERRPAIVDQLHARAIAAGVITAEEAANRSSALLAALGDGTLLMTTLFWVTSGTKPR
ncbi:MAG: methyltransferase domain-containing protein [Dehalococcoidia bacterium]